MITVQINFKTVEEAIVGLARLQGGAAAKAVKVPVQNVAAPAGDSAAPPSQSQHGPVAPAAGQQPVAATPDKPARKPRADKGKERGAYKPRQEQNAGAASATPDSETSGNALTAVPDPSKAADQAANSMSTPAEAPGVVADTTATASTTAAPAPSATTVASEADAQRALEGMFKTKGMAVAQAVLGQFNVTRLRDLPADKRAAFIKAAEEASK